MTSDALWGDTLSGDAAAIFRRWQTDLAPRGFNLIPRILDYPHGVPGEAGLFLAW